MKKLLSLLDIKHAILGDVRFRELFPELKEDFEKILSNPSCSCNKPIYNKVFKYRDKLSQYFKDSRTIGLGTTNEAKQNNYWTVHNCHVNELEKFLNSMHRAGKKQVVVSRYEDQVTVVINEPSNTF